MIEELATVVKIENHQVWVESRQAGACGGCRQKASCTAGAIDSVFKKKKSIPVDSEILVKTGDQVIVAIDENLLLRASLLLYFVPLVALFTGAGIADWLISDETSYADLWIAGSAVLSFLLSLWSINKAQTRLILNYYARPVVVRKV